METNNGLELYLNISDHDIDKDSGEDFTECGQLNLDVTYNGTTVYRSYRILMRSDFFEIPDEPADMYPEDHETILADDLYIKVSLGGNDSVIVIDTDLNNLVKGCKDSVTLGMIVRDPDNNYYDR